MKAAKCLIFAGYVIIGMTGCQSWHQFHRLPDEVPPTAAGDMPRELSKVVLPAYRIEPPDVLSIEAVRLVPNASYKLNTLDGVRIQVRRSLLNRIAPADILGIRALGAPELAPIEGQYLVQPNGSLVLGELYGSVNVGFLTLREAKDKIESHLAGSLTAPEVSLNLAEAGLPVDGPFAIAIDGTVDFGTYGSVELAGLTSSEAKAALHKHFSQYFESPKITLATVATSTQQQVTGEHLVGPDGTVTLGTYGSVPVIGLTVDEAAAKIEKHLAKNLNDPDVAVTVFSYNSKFFYIIAEGAGFGDQVYRFPITGNETVLDALTQINGLTEASSSRMWIARATSTPGDYQILPVDWHRVISLGAADSNYQLLPGDRLFIAEDQLVAFGRTIEKLTLPLERIMGFTILGAETATRLSGGVLRGGGNPRAATF